MTRIVIRRPLTPMTRHGHKRKGKPVDAWKKDLFQEQDENHNNNNNNNNSNDVVRIRGVNLNAIEQIANGVERMMSSWHLDTFERGQKQAKTIEAPANNATTTAASGPVHLALEKQNITCSPAAACERSVGTECHRTEQVVVTEPPSFRVADSASTPPHDPNPVRDYYCSHQSPVVENRIQSPFPKEEPHASTLAHLAPDAGVDKATFIDVEAPCNVIDHGPDCGAISQYRPCRFETLEVGGRPLTMPALLDGTEALRNKFESLINRTSGAPLIQERPCSAPPEISSVEELQLALIECATEYEIQTLDARMKMQGMKRAISSCDFNQKPVSSEMIQCIKIPHYALQKVCRKEVMKPEKVKDMIVKPTSQPFKKKERVFDRQKRSLDEALNHVDRLQREVVKKDRELVEWQLKEKETMHKLDKKTGDLQAEPRKLFLALPALRESLRPIKTEQIRAPLVERSQKQANMENKSGPRDCCSLNSRLQFLEERTSEMDELKVTMSKLASNMADLSMAFKDHVQFVNHRLSAIHGHVMKRNMSPAAQLEPASYGNQLQLQAGVETVEAEREIARSPSVLLE